MLSDFESLAAILTYIRRSNGVTPQDVGDHLGLGRTVIGQKLNDLSTTGILEMADKGRSTGGRAPRILRIQSNFGVVLCVDVHVTGMRVGIADLEGTLIASHETSIPVANGPDKVLDEVERLGKELLENNPHGKLLGIGIGLPGPVEFITGKPIAPPIMPGWDGYDVKFRLRNAFSVPVLVDNDVNILALGELRGDKDIDVQDILFVKIGAGIGAGLISGGKIHRGGNGCAGDIGHVYIAEADNVVCRCGNMGCLESIAGGTALSNEGLRLAQSGTSKELASIFDATQNITVQDLANAANHGDAAARALLNHSGKLVGATLATLVSFYNPELVVLGGHVARAGDYVLASIREVVYRRSLPLATRTLRIEPSKLGSSAGMIGASHLALDSLFSAKELEQWLISK